MPKVREKRPTPLKQIVLFGLEAEDTRSKPSFLSLAFQGHNVRIVMINGEPWWVLADVARVLKYRDAANASRILRDRHRGTHSVSTPSGTQDMVVISEAGLYRLMMRSDSLEAEPFQDWITDEVIPTIRKTGTYSARPNDRVARTARRLKCDHDTALKRVENIDLNKQTHARIFENGGGSFHAAKWHDGVYRGQFNKTTKELRKLLGMKGGTPLDRMSLLLLAQNGHAKAVTERMIAEASEKIPIADHPRILEVVARELAVADLERLPDSDNGIRDDPDRGLILDVIRRQIERA